MKYLDEFRNAKIAKAIAELIKSEAVSIRMPLKIMEVCGTHTMAIGRYGIRGLLPGNIELISGPGCPVCVTPGNYIDAAINLADSGRKIITFGDMLNVPGNSGMTLTMAKSQGASVEICYSPIEALEKARSFPEQEIVFLAVGFETTIAAIIKMLDYAVLSDIKNLSLLVSFKRIIPAMKAILDDKDIKINAFICPAHVSAIIGASAYDEISSIYHTPFVIAGFEPLDILSSILEILKQISAGKAVVANEYSRVVRKTGNTKAMSLIDKYLDINDAVWRGLGTIPQSGYVLKNQYSGFDTASRYKIVYQEEKSLAECRCGDVLKGKIRPPNCPLFAEKCCPENPVGPCMVSSEGTCAAYYKYEK
jgi:hydrogenase expression/formation protein HypD